MAICVFAATLLSYTSGAKAFTSERIIPSSIARHSDGIGGDASQATSRANDGKDAMTSRQVAMIKKLRLRMKARSPDGA